MTPQDPTAQDQPVSDQPTAETDVMAKLWSETPKRLIDFARTLERQRDAARAELEQVKGYLKEWQDADPIRTEREFQLRADLAAAREENARFRAALTDIGEYIGEGGPNTPWQAIVRDCGIKARAALNPNPSST